LKVPIDRRRRPQAPPPTDRPAMLDEAAVEREEVLLWAPGDDAEDVWDDTELIKARPPPPAPHRSRTGEPTHTSCKKCSIPSFRGLDCCSPGG